LVIDDVINRIKPDVFYVYILPNMSSLN
jgi:hypothetical protein